MPRPSPRGEDDGWLLGHFLDYERSASGLADGPLARAWLDYPLPLGFHGHFNAA